MQEMKLQIKIPPVIGYLHHAYFLSIIQEHGCFEKWFYANYIQLNYFPGNNWLNFYRLNLIRSDYCSLIDYQLIKNLNLNYNKINIIEFTVNCLKQGYFVLLFIDEYYHPGRRAFKKAHLTHENLIFGFNLKTKSFYTAGYNQGGDYTYSEISFTITEKAYNHVKSDEPVKILKPKDTVSCEFDIQSVKNLLEDYINSANTSERNRMITAPVRDCIYGVDIYKHLVLYFEKITGAKEEIDVRLLHILWEHKKCMLSRIQYLYENKYLPALDPVYTDYAEVEKEAAQIRLLQIKYNLTYNRNLVNQIIDALQKMQNRETAILCRLLGEIAG